MTMGTLGMAEFNLPESTYEVPEYKESGMQNMAAIVRTLLNDFGAGHVQFNTINKDVLVDAQKHPENYPTLMVRVAGYSVYFNDLARDTQDHVIARTEHHF